VRGPLSKVLLGALVCAAAWGGSAALRPLELGREAVLAEEEQAEVADAGPLATLADQIHDRLAERVPAIGAELRQRLALTIVREAEAARLDPLLVLAVIEVESRFDAEALSEAGAMGLMQLREPTLLKELRRQGIPGDPRDPVKNVQAGVHYLRRLLDAFGREEVALMAYNAGPNRILGYIREGGIPERFQVYPRRVRAELHRLKRDLAPPAAAAAEPSGGAPTVVVAERAAG
jgi:soluble lytic murein transglycosylase-like protein